MKRDSFLKATLKSYQAFLSTLRDVPSTTRRK